MNRPPTTPDRLAERLRTAAYLRRRTAIDIIRAALNSYLDELDDAPIDSIPTPAGLDYLAARRQQHPRARTTGDR